MEKEITKYIGILKVEDPSMIGIGIEFKSRLSNDEEYLKKWSDYWQSKNKNGNEGPLITSRRYTCTIMPNTPELDKMFNDSVLLDMTPITEREKLEQERIQLIFRRMMSDDNYGSDSDALGGDRLVVDECKLSK